MCTKCLPFAATSFCFFLFCHCLPKVCFHHLTQLHEMVKANEWMEFSARADCPLLCHPRSWSACPDSQTEPPLFQQFVPTVSCPITGHHWNELGSIFTLSLQVFVHIDENSSSAEPSLLQDEQIQVSQPFFRGDTLLSLHYLCEPLLGSLQYIHISPYWADKNGTQYFRCDLTLSPACTGTYEVTPPHTQNFALLVELHVASISPFLYLVKVLLDGITTLCSISHS